MNLRSSGATPVASRNHRKRAALALGRVAIICMALHGHHVHAAQPAWHGTAMHYVADNSRLADVLLDVARAGGIAMDVSRDVKGSVNGVFEQTPADVFRALVEAWGLSWYYDGQSVHVSTATDAKTRTIPITPLTRDDVATLLHSLALDDAHLPLRYSDTTVKIAGPSRFVDAVTEAIARARQQAPGNVQLDQTDIHVFPLRYAQAQDITFVSNSRQQVIPGVASLLRRLMDNTSVPLQAAVEQRPQSDATRANRGGVPPLPSLPGFGEARATALPLDATDPVATQTPAVRRNIVADTRTNSVVVYDLAAMMPNYQRVITMLDQPQDLVEISAVVIDVSSDAAQELGVRWGAGASSSRPGAPPYGRGFAVLPGVLPAAAAASAGLNLTTLIGDSAHYLYEQVHAMELNGRARILSRPQVLTLNNAEAVLASHNSVYVRVAGNQDANLFNVDTGLTLKVTPTVERGDGRGDRNRVLLSIQIEDGAFDTSGSVDGIPRVNNNSIITQAVVADGDSLLIGGYQYEHTQDNSSKVPLLGDIPVVGALFRDTRTSVERTERLVMITPRIRPVTPSPSDAVAAPPMAAVAPTNFPNTALAATPAAIPTAPPRRDVTSAAPQTLPPSYSPLPTGISGRLTPLTENAQ